MTEIFLLSEVLNLLPIEIYLFLVVVIPLGVCFAKWGYDMTWLKATFLCACLSWVYFNLWMGKLYPPDNGFANLVYFVSGWFWLLPIFALCAIGFWFADRRWPTIKDSGFAQCGALVCAGITAVIVLWNLGGWMSEDRAVTEARQQLSQRGYEPKGREIPEYQRGHWTVRYPDTDFGEIRLDRNGRMSWIGGPG